MLPTLFKHHMRTNFLFFVLEIEALKIGVFLEKGVPKD